MPVHASPKSLDAIRERLLPAIDTRAAASGHLTGIGHHEASRIVAIAGTRVVLRVDVALCAML